MWLHDDKPELFERTAKFISIKEYLFFRLFGQYIVDHSIASGYRIIYQSLTDNLYNRWNILNGPKNGSLPSTPFVIGASDGVLSNLGVNAIKPGVVAATIGTSGAIRTVVDRPVTDPKGRTFCYALTENYGL